MPEVLCTEPVPTSTHYPCSYPPVAADELGFALSVFVAAANRTLVRSRPEMARLSDPKLVERERLFDDLLVHGAQVDDRRVSPYQATLHSAFAALWSDYKNHEMRDSICARVLCFYFLMEQTEGKAVEPWMSASPERPEEVLLEPVVVEALAAMPLLAETGLTKAALVSAIYATHPKAC